jgi:hypothetical protein
MRHLLPIHQPLPTPPLLPRRVHPLPPPPATPPLPPPNIRMPRRLKHVQRKLQKQRPLQPHRHPLIQRRRERDEDARPVQVARVLVPVLAPFVALLRAGSLLEGEARDEHQQGGEEDGAEDGGVEGGVGAAVHEPVGGGRDGGGEDPELYEHLAEVVGVAGPREEALVADRRLISGAAPEEVFLDIAHALHEQPGGEQDHACDIPPGSEIRLGELRHVGRVQDRGWEGYGPHPDHLEDPETEELEEVVPFVVKAVIFPRLENAEEEEGGEAEAPDHYEEGDDDLARMVVAAECEGYDGENDEVGSAREICGLLVVMGGGSRGRIYR